MSARPEVTPNKRGARSRELVLDAAERVMAEHGYDGATTGAIVKEAGIPISSVYHYFGSKDGVLLAVMERGAERFFQAVPELDELVGTPEQHMAIVLATLRLTLDEHPDFLRLVVVMATQPPTGSTQEAHAVVTRVRDEALRRLRKQFALVFDIQPRSAIAGKLARFTLATIDGAFVAAQADPKVKIDTLLEYLPNALVAIHAAMAE